MPIIVEVVIFELYTSNVLEAIRIKLLEVYRGPLLAYSVEKLAKKETPYEIIGY